MAELWAYDFVRHALLAGLLASVLCGVVGTLVVVKRLVFISGGIAHAAFGGLGFVYWLGGDPRLGAAAAAVLTALTLGPERRERSHDATIGVLWAVGMALGIVFIHRTPGYAPNLMAYLFGNILSVSATDVWLLAGLDLLVVGLFALFYKEIVAVVFDEDFAAAQGVPVRWIMTVLLALLALALVLLIEVVGIILVIALLTIPPLTARLVVDRFLALVLLSTALGAAIVVGGLVASYYLDLPSGPTVVLLGAAVLVLATAGRRLVVRRRVGQAGPADGLAADAGGGTP